MAMGIDILVRFTVVAESEPEARMWLETELGTVRLAPGPVDSWATLHEHPCVRIGGRTLRVAEETEYGEKPNVVFNLRPIRVD